MFSRHARGQSQTKSIRESKEWAIFAAASYPVEPLEKRLLLITNDLGMKAAGGDWDTGSN